MVKGFPVPHGFSEIEMAGLAVWQDLNDIAVILILKMKGLCLFFKINGHDIVSSGITGP